MPASVFVVTPTSDRVRLDNNDRGVASFSVTNTTKRTLRRVMVRHAERTCPAVQGGAELTFRPDETQLFSVALRISAGGRFLRLRLSLLRSKRDNPDEGTSKVRLSSAKCRKTKGGEDIPENSLCDRSVSEEHRPPGRSELGC
jgi:hypothetical protein